MNSDDSLLPVLHVHLMAINHFSTAQTMFYYSLHKLQQECLHNHLVLFINALYSYFSWTSEEKAKLLSAISVVQVSCALLLKGMPKPIFIKNHFLPHCCPTPSISKITFLQLWIWSWDYQMSILLAQDQWHLLKYLRLAARAHYRWEMKSVFDRYLFTFYSASFFLSSSLKNSFLPPTSLHHIHLIVKYFIIQ